MAVSRIINQIIPGSLLLVATGGSQPLSANTFTTLSITASRDPLSRLSANIFSIPLTGNYQFVSKIRMNDNTAITNYSQGVHTDNIDGTWVIWTNTNIGAATNRNGLLNIRSGTFNINDQIRLYAFSGINATIAGCELNIIYLGE